MTMDLFKEKSNTLVSSSKKCPYPFKTQLLKWVGNKQRFAHEIISYFPSKFNTYYEPFVGSGAIIGTLAPLKGVAGDTLKPLVELWQHVVGKPNLLNEWYRVRYELVRKMGKVEAYNFIKDSFNKKANPGDLLFISRTCYGGVIRFRKADGYISTPCGIHDPVSPQSFSDRLFLWNKRLQGSSFFHADFEELFNMAKKGDLIYCDPPYMHSQAILYGAQSFSVDRLYKVIDSAKRRGIFVALSLDGHKKSGQVNCDIKVPKGLFHRTTFVNCGGSMLKRFQLKDKTSENEMVSDRLLLTW